MIFNNAPDHNPRCLSDIMLNETILENALTCVTPEKYKPIVINQILAELDSGSHMLPITMPVAVLGTECTSSSQ